MFDVTAAGTWTHLHTVAAGENPSYLLIDEFRQALHCVHGDGSALSTFRIETSGELAPLGSRPTQGTNPVHLALSASRRWLLVANYASGNLVSLPVNDDGSLGNAAHVLALPNRPGPHRTQQRGAHPHQVLLDPSGHWLLVPDKGGDAVHTVAIDEHCGELRLVSTFSTAPMSGPRHMAFSADGSRAWLVLELSSQVLAVRFDATSGSLRAVQRTSSVPDWFTGENTGAGIALSPDESFLYVTNRGHGSAVRFDIDRERGTLSSPAWTNVQGEVPRFITILPECDSVVVANEDADSIVHVDAGNLKATQLATTGSPVCIAFTSHPKGTP
ncbi:lactonase family protein [Variovorax sp. J22R24]|uniref:lactonase family protein n=1 Tax=Variovorax gracilis TaxID=3053502 RepID=UPI002576A11C|nr:lactonase family protein [Variovorax sp. J22R24]MDM0109170.1 lactonase family protein [Variovorax sp. J22R24]